MESKKINQLATEMAPASTDLTIIGDPITGVSKKVTLEQISSLFSGLVSFYANLAAFPATGEVDTIYCAKDTQKLYLWSGSAYVEVFPSQAVLNTYQLLSAKGVANGYASLDSGGKVPIAQLPSSIMEYKGLWSAATNTPTLADGTGDTGDVYICSAAGTVNFGAGAITFAVGDYVIYSGTIWQRSSGAVGTVTSVGLSSATSGVTIGSTPVTTSGTITLAIATATTSQNGLLSSTDWATFNAKQNAITLTTTGTSGASTLVGSTLNIPNYGSSLTGYVPYTGATANVDLGTFNLTADVITGATGSFASSGGSDTFAINHSSGAGIALNITKGGSGEGLYINKTSGSGNAATIIGTLNATTLVKSGGTSSQFLKADGTVDTTSYGTGSVTSVAALTLGTTGTDLSSTVANGTTTPVITLNVPTASATNRGALSSADWTTFNNKQSTLSLTTTGNSGSATLVSNTLNVPTYTLAGLGGISLTSLSATTPLSYNNTTGAFSIQVANTSQDGYLSSTDWNTFNSKQSTITNPVTGTGTSGQVTYFNGTSSVTSSSNFKFDGTNLTIGNPSSALAQLHIYNASAAASFLLQTNSTTDYSEIAVRNNSSTATSYFRQYSTAATGSDFGISRAGLALFFSNYATNFAIGTRNGGDLILGTADTERARITSTGNVLIGQTVASGSVNGMYFRVGVESGFIVTSDVALQLSRLATTGDIQTFYSGSTRVGKIAVGSSSFTFESANNGGITVTSAGNVGIGTSTPTTYSLAGKHLELYGGSDYSFFHNNTATVKSFFASNEASLLAALFTFSAHPLTFGTSNTERMRITSGGNVGIGNTGASDQRLSLSGVDNTSSNYALVVKNSSLSTLLYVRNDGQCYISGLAWVYGSDRRLKENINYIETGLDKILALKPAKFDYIDGAKNNIGWIAQDVEQIIPEAISINTINDKGYLGLKSDFIVPYLVKAIQEQQKQIEELKAKIK